MFSQVIVSHIFGGLKLSVSDRWPIQLMFCWSSVDGSRLGPEKMPCVPISTPCKYWYWCIVTRKEIEEAFIIIIYVYYTYHYDYTVLFIGILWDFISLFRGYYIDPFPKKWFVLEDPQDVSLMKSQIPTVVCFDILLLHEKMVQTGQQMVTNGSTW